MIKFSVSSFAAKPAASRPLSRPFKAVALAVATFGIALSASPATAQTFGQAELNQDRFISVAAPGGRLTGPQLLIIEQITDARPCWSTSGTRPTTVEPLLLNFDFSGICGRSTDSNGYSIRVNNQDLGSIYRLQLRESGSELLLLGVPRDGSTPIRIGRTNGISPNGFTKIELNPGWRLTRRTFQGQTLGHNYLTNDAPLAQVLAESGGPIASPPSTPPTTPPTTPPPSTAPAFPDISGDVYASAIRRAAEIGFIAGFEDGTFRPRQAVTREQAVSMVIDALQTRVPNMNVPTSVGSNPFPDVAAGRWSAPKIAFAQQTGIVTGDVGGTFRPAASVSRAELMAIVRRAAEYERRQTGRNPELPVTQQARTFSDTQGHWAQSLISNMSSFCGVATPLNESGTAFAPNSPALRNYASAAFVRMLDCETGQQAP